MDNLLLVEAFDASGRRTDAAVIGAQTTLNGEQIPLLANNDGSFQFAPVDISGVFSSAEPRQLRLTTVDVGVVGQSSDVFLVTKADEAPARSSQAGPNVGALFVGASVGAGRMQDTTTGVGGGQLDLRAGYFSNPSLGWVITGNAFLHQTANDEDLSLLGGSFGPEYHLIPPLWVSLGVGVASLTSSTPTVANGVTSTSRRKQFAPGGDLGVGFDFYRGQSPSGLAVGVAFKSQFAYLENSPIFTTSGMLGVRWYGGGAGPSVGGTTAAAPVGAPGGEIDASSVASSCGDMVKAILAGFLTGSSECNYRLGPAALIPQFVSSFTTKLLGGSRYAVWLGRMLNGNALQGVSAEFNAAEGGIRLLRHAGKQVTKGALLATGTPKAAQAWRIARTPKRVLVWFDDRLIYADDNPPEGLETGVSTSDGQMQVLQAKREPASDQQVKSWETLPAVAWPTEAPPPPIAAPPTPVEAAREPEPAPVAPPASVRSELVLLREYYAALNSGAFEANRYFAPQVARYISRRNLSSNAIQSYVTTAFPKQFQQSRFTMDESSFAEDTPGKFSFTEHATYYNVAQARFERVVSLARAYFDASGKLTHLWQDKVLERQVAAQPFP